MDTDLFRGKIVRLEKYGLGFVEAEDTGKQYPFRFDQLAGFKGEPLREMSIRTGSKVSFRLQGGKVSEVHAIDMMEQHKSTGMEWSKVLASALVGIAVGVSISEGGGSPVAIMAGAMIFTGIMLWVLRAIK